MRELMPHAPFLLPGHRRAGRRGRRPRARLRARAAPAGLVSASRSIADAHEAAGGEPAAAARAEAERLRDAGLGARPEPRRGSAGRAGIIEPMAGRSPARFLAPLALVAFALALFIVVSSATKDDAGDAGRDGTRAAPARADRHAASGSKKKRKTTRSLHGQARRHPSGIAEKTACRSSRSSSSTPTSTRRRSRPGTKIKLR